MPLETILKSENRQDQDDPNRVWVEIDRGIRSKENFRQLEAILKMLNLFKSQTASTTLVSAALIKLAALFHEGSNEMRLNVMKILERLGDKLEKSSMLDEPIKSIYLLMHSNDCVARALTLRTLAILWKILSDDVEAHLHIGSALDSNDEVELLAAIKAANFFLPRSKTFALSISPKLIALIEDLTTPLTIKSWIVPLFEHMTHDANVSSKGREVLTSLINNDATEQFLEVAVPTLARLAVKSHVEIGETVTFFLDFVQREPRRKCRKLILENLIPIARAGSIVWLESTTNTLIRFASESNDDFVRLQIFRIIEVLISRGAFFSPTTIVELKQLLQLYTVDKNFFIAFQACSTTVRLIFTSQAHLQNASTESPRKAHRQSEIGFSQKMLEDLLENVEIGLCCLVTETIHSNKIRLLKATLRLIEQISRSNRSSGENFVNFLLFCCEKVENAEILSDLTLCLVRLSTSNKSLIVQETSRIRNLISLRSSNEKIRYNLLCLLVISNPNDLVEILVEVERISGWKRFLLGRWCVRHCLFRIGRVLLENLLEFLQIPIDRTWLKSLIAISRGEELLQTPIDFSNDEPQEFYRNLSEASSFYELSFIQIPTRATIQTEDDRSVEFNFDFQRNYTELRSALVEKFRDFIQTIDQFDLGMFHFDVFAKRTFSMIAKRFSSISSRFDDFQQSSFDADDQTLWCLTYNRFICDLMSSVINRIIRNHALDKNFWLEKFREISWRDGFSEENFRRVERAIDSTLNKFQTRRNSTRKSSNIDEDLAAAQFLAVTLIKIAVPIPRMFFQRLQQTVVQLVVSPNESEDRPVHEPDALLPVQIHGQIDTSFHRAPLRTVKQVFVEVLTNQEIKKKRKKNVSNIDEIVHDESYRDAKASLFSADPMHMKTNENDFDHYKNVILNEELKDNRFHAGFILHLGSVTNYNIHVRVSFEDNNGQRWTNVADKTICIKLNNRRQSRINGNHRSNPVQASSATTMNN